ncbi:MAG: GatB/YqeY domain-containing protein [Patescibacteria group bacterium]
MSGSLVDRISNDLTAALRAGEEVRVGTLRLLRSAIHNREIEKRGKGAALTEDDVAEVVAREAKKRKESIHLFTEGKRQDLAEKETRELEVLAAYLPEQASDEEVRRVVAAALAVVKPASPKDFGKVMGEAMKTLKGRVETDAVSRLIKESLG